MEDRLAAYIDRKSIEVETLKKSIYRADTIAKNCRSIGNLSDAYLNILNLNGGYIGSAFRDIDDPVYNMLREAHKMLRIILDDQYFLDIDKKEKAVRGLAFKIETRRMTENEYKALLTATSEDIAEVSPQLVN